MTHKKDVIKRALAMFLVAASLFLLPGMTQLMDAAAAFVPEKVETASSDEKTPSLKPDGEAVLAPKPVEWRRGDAPSGTVSIQIATAPGQARARTLAASGGGVPDMTLAMRRSYPAY